MITRHFLHYKFTKKISFSDNTARSLFSIFKPSAPPVFNIFLHNRTRKTKLPEPNKAII